MTDAAQNGKPDRSGKSLLKWRAVLGAVGGALLVGFGPALWNSVFGHQPSIEYGVVVFSTADKAPAIAKATITLSIPTRQDQKHDTNPDGAAIFVLPATLGQKAATLRVSRDGFRPLEREVTIPPSSAKETVYIDPLLPPPPNEIPKVFSSGPKASGLGANLSEWYELCSDPASPGYRVGSVQFTLTGDRSCGAWSECKESRHTQDQVCYQFRLQGHNEWFPPRPAFSEGVLKVSFVH